MAEPASLSCAVGIQRLYDFKREGAVEHCHFMAQYASKIEYYISLPVGVKGHQVSINISMGVQAEAKELQRGSSALRPNSIVARRK